MDVITIDVPEIGNRSYIAHDGKSAVVIDPSRRIHQIVDEAKKANLKIEAIFETHIHNDYITGGYALAKKLNVPYYVSDQEDVHFEHQAIKPDQLVNIGSLSITALGSPGHTHTHLSYLVEQPGRTSLLFSGGSLLYGAVGRPDLISEQDTPLLARAQYETAQSYAKRLDPTTLLYPTHGFGSFCAVTDTENVAISTIGQQLESNQVFTAKDESSFVKDLLSRLDDYPSYYAYMAPANLIGPSLPKLDEPTSLNKESLNRAIHEGVAIVDMRSRRAYAKKHLSGTYNIELSGSLATYVGWLIQWGEPFILVAESKVEVSIAQEQLSLIGKEIIDGQISPELLLESVTTTNSYPVRSFSDLAQVPKGSIVILDVRRTSEWQKGHILSALRIPLHELISRADEISSGKETWVHCASGFRASIATSILSGLAKKPVLIDDNFNNAKKAGIDITKGEV
jgi:hydroxyacylglutathione hydrolase